MAHRHAVPPERPEPAESEAPQSIGDRYRVIEQLGRGGSALVYHVHDTSTGHSLALKQLRADLPGDRDAGALFEREFYTLAQLSHPSAIEVYDFGIDARGPYYTMELLQGDDLGGLAPLPYRTACSLLVQVCSCLSLLHLRGLVHRDVTPRNVRCTLTGDAKLIDFGAMVAMGPCGRGVGTPAFTSPEVLLQLSVDARTDLYSLGATLYYTLTGRLPYGARNFADLREAWSRDPAPPGELVDDIPPALDALVLSLLQIDPAGRPRSANEVMQRLAALSGDPRPISSAPPLLGLPTPALVGREAEQRRFRKRLQRALEGVGGGLCIEGEAGSGRSRLLESCVLQAKILGATVLHVTGRAALDAAFSAAYDLAEQLLDALPAAAVRCAQEAGIRETLFEPSAVSGRQWLRDPAAIEHSKLHGALFDWLRRVAASHALLIAVDDVERIDDASLGLLARLADAGKHGRVLIAIALHSPGREPERPLLEALRQRCQIMKLSALTREQLETLFSSLFGAVPHLSLLSDRVQRLAAGNPRESMALLQHLLDRRAISFRDGDWVLPSELELSALPADAESALQARIALLPALARQLIELQAVSLPDVFSRADYLELIGQDQASRIDDALSVLMRNQMLVSDGRAYTLSQLPLRLGVLSQLDAERRSQLHGQLAELCARRRRHPLREVHHLLQAERVPAALDRLAALLARDPDGDLYQHAGLEAKVMAATLASAFELARSSLRPPREIHELARHLTGFSLIADSGLYYRYAPAWLAQVELDCGLTDYRSSDPQLPAAERLQQAWRRMAARDPAQRVYSVEEALRFLVRHVITSMVMAARNHDAALSASLPGLLEPFAGLTPLLHAHWQNTLGANELTFGARPERARDNGHKTFELLRQVQGSERRWVEPLQYGVAYCVAIVDVMLGDPAAEHWIEVLDRHPHQQLLAGYLRRLQCIYAGDAEGAERYRKQAELAALQSSDRLVIDAPLRVELIAQVHAGDLVGVKMAADRIAQLAAAAPGWLPYHALAEGCFQRLRGDAPAALLALERCLALTSPDVPDLAPDLGAWVHASAAYVAVLCELDRAEEARSFGTDALAQCARLDIVALAHDIERELALAEAKLGDLASAQHRIDHLIALRAGCAASHRALDYEARARVAILAQDTATASHFAQLGGASSGPEARVSLAPRQSRLVHEARRAGIALEAPRSEFESSVLGRSQLQATVPPEIDDWLGTRQLPRERALLALDRLCRSAGASSGQLYLNTLRGLELAAVYGMIADPALDAFAQAYWERCLDRERTVPLLDCDTDTAWVSQSANTFRVLVLRSNSAEKPGPIGLCAMSTERVASFSSESEQLGVALSDYLERLGDAITAGQP